LIHNAYIPKGEAPNLNSKEMKVELMWMLEMDNLLLTYYENITGTNKRVLAQTLDKGDYLDAQQAKALGLVDKIIGKKCNPNGDEK
jgi:ATP-dependent protease ClpP protease subunit